MQAGRDEYVPKMLSLTLSLRGLREVDKISPLDTTSGWLPAVLHEANCRGEVMIAELQSARQSYVVLSRETGWIPTDSRESGRRDNNLPEANSKMSSGLAF